MSLLGVCAVGRLRVLFAAVRCLFIIELNLTRFCSNQAKIFCCGWSNTSKLLTSRSKTVIYFQHLIFVSASFFSKYWIDFDICIYWNPHFSIRYWVSACAGRVFQINGKIKFKVFTTVCRHCLSMLGFWFESKLLFVLSLTNGVLVEKKPTDIENFQSLNGLPKLDILTLSCSAYFQLNSRQI